MASTLITSQRGYFPVGLSQLLEEMFKMLQFSSSVFLFIIFILALLIWKVDGYQPLGLNIQGLEQDPSRTASGF